LPASNRVVPAPIFPPIRFRRRRSIDKKVLVRAVVIVPNGFFVRTKENQHTLSGLDGSRLSYAGPKANHVSKVSNHFFAPPKAILSHRAADRAESGGRPWTPRDYAALPAKGYARNAIVHRAVRLVAERHRRAVIRAL